MIIFRTTICRVWMICRPTMKLARIGIQLRSLKLDMCRCNIEKKFKVGYWNIRTITCYLMIVAIDCLVIVIIDCLVIVVKSATLMKGLTITRLSTLSIKLLMIVPIN